MDFYIYNHARIIPMQMVKMKAPPNLSKSQRKKKTKDLPKKQFPYKLIAFVSLVLVIGIVATYMLFATITSFFSHISENKTTSEPKGIEWFENKSIALSSMKTNIDVMTVKINTYKQKHGTNISRYTQNEKTQLETMTAALTLMTYSYNTMAAEYNSHRDEMNRSWNRSLPREIYDIPPSE